MPNKFTEGARVRVIDNLRLGHTDGRAPYIGQTGTVREAPEDDSRGLFIERSYTVELDEGGHGKWTREELDPISGPDPLREGMTPLDLADHVSVFIRECRTRVLGVGAEQYSNGSRQKFEDMSPIKILEAAREEIQDLAVYAAMADIQVQRLLAAIRRSEERDSRNG